jgi:drug/metabolite transporter (DMT)-like permease
MAGGADSSKPSNRAAISNPTAGNWASVLLLGFVWGGAFLGIALALRGFGPFTVAAGRLSFAAIAMLALASVPRTRSGPSATWQHAPYIVIMGVIGMALPFLLLSWGQTRVTSGFAGVAMSSVALFILPMAHFLVPGDQLTTRKSAGFAMGFAGVVILLGPSLVTEGWTGPESLGRLACIGAAVCYAVASLTTRLAPPIDPIALATWQVTLGALALAPIALIVEGVPKVFDPQATFALIALALIPTALAAFLRVIVIRSAGPTFMSLVGFQVPVWAVVFGIVFLGEPVSASLFIALSLVLGGMAVNQWPALRRLF